MRGGASNRKTFPVNRKMDLVSTGKFRNENLEISRVLAKLHNISSNLIHLQEQI